MADQQSDLQWTEWKPLAEPARYDGHAVYRIRLVDQGGPVTIPRFLDADPEGIISIGRTTGMGGRREQFLCGIEKCYGHPSGNLIYYLRRFGTLSAKFPNARIEYCFARLGDKEDTERHEGRLIKTYFLRFGEPPPLNSSIPDRYNDGVWKELAVASPQGPCQPMD